MSRPQTDEYPEQLEGVLDALVNSGREAAEQVLAPISYPRHEVVVRSDPSETVIAGIYIRDRFHCRYCGCRVIPTQVMRLVAAIFPEDFPYHPNWKGGQTHPAIVSRSATLDHVVAWTLGGRNDPENLVCACWICNRVKGDLTTRQLGWEVLSIPDETSWDGLTRYYRPLWELAGAPTGSEHHLWMRLYEEALRDRT
jgi:5-methylcytosine-specific restriction endonuclease McrA